MSFGMKSFHEVGLLRDLDVHLIESLIRTFLTRGNPPSEEIKTLLALAVRVTNEGHVCLDLHSDHWWQLDRIRRDNEEQTSAREKQILSLPAPRNAQRALLNCPEWVGSGESSLPFILERNRLYLRRFWNYEKRVANRLRALAEREPTPIPAQLRTQLATVTFGREGQFRPTPSQLDAVQRGLKNRLTIITGGPGTGKTTIAALLLRLLVAQAENTAPLRIRMAAPTGKAAARLQESVGSEISTDTRQILWEPASTLDRLLGYQRNSPYFHYNRETPLPADIVLIDETSMIDLPKMAKLLDAITPQTRLILLGDKNQLASVDPGSVMAELCEAAALRHCIVELTESKRFDADSAVTPISQAVRAGDADSAWKLLTDPSIGSANKKVTLHDATAFTPRDVPKDFAEIVRTRYRAFLAAKTPAEAFRALSAFRVLCALRRGATGSNRINAFIEDLLFPNRKGDFYDHRVILVTKNDYDMHLFNGDVGILLPNEEGDLVAHFETREQPLPTRLLPAHESAFAMTVHKAQGSGFGHIALILPTQEGPILTRELIYTGLTRTETGVDLWCEPSTFKSGVTRLTARSMGLREQLNIPASTPEPNPST